jgi:putative intracellular protease/amidase
MIKYERLLAAALLFFMLGSASAKPTDAPATEYGDTGDAVGTISPHAQLVRFLLQPVENPNQLQGYRVAILAADGVDGFDLEVPRLFLAERGAIVHIIVPRPRQVLEAAGSGAFIKAKTHIAVLEPSGEQDTASFDRFLDQVRAEDYDVIYLPGHPGEGGGLGDQNSIAFLQQAARQGKPIFAAGNSPDALVKAGLLDRSIYTSRDAFDMPVLMDRLTATLLTRPATVAQ